MTHQPKRRRLADIVWMVRLSNVRRILTASNFTQGAACWLGIYALGLAYARGVWIGIGR